MEVLRWLILGCCSWWAQSLLAIEAPLVLVDQPQVNAEPIRFQGQGLLCRVRGVEREIELSQMVAWGSWRDSARGPQVVLHDGSVLIGDPAVLTSRELTVVTPEFGQIKIPRPLIAGIIFLPDIDTIDRDRLLHELTTTPRDEESLRLANGDRIDGVAVSVETSPRSQWIKTLKIGQSNTLLDTENVVAIVGPRSDDDAEALAHPRLWVGLTDGTRLAVKEWTIQPSQIEWRLESGLRLTTDVTLFWPQITWLQPAPEGFTYLSDVPRAGFKHIPMLSLNWGLGIDRNVLGGALRSQGNWYAKGLGMHSAARSAYNLAGQYRWLIADVALDDRAEGRGSVVFRVFVDSAPAGQPANWSLGYESPIVRAGDRPVPVRLNVAGAERIALVVDFADRGSERDYANWLHARLVP